MTNDKGTIKIPREDFERHNTKRKTLGESWAEYIDGQAPDGFELSDDDIQHIINEIAATADGEGRVDSDALAREVASQLDYAAMADTVAEEVVSRLR